MNTTKHAKVRMQQRGIPPLIIDLLEGYGEEQYDHHGAVILFFSKKSRRQLEKNIGAAPLRRLNEWLDSYAVIGDDGAIITAGIRIDRIKH